MSDEPSHSSQRGQGPSRGPHREKTFVSFVVSDENRLAFTAATHVAASPGDAYSPLVICGPTGVGKTHLLRAIAHHVESNHEDLRAVEVDYLTVSYRPHRRLLSQPIDGDLLLVSHRSGTSDDQSSRSLLIRGRYQVVLTCRTVSNARAVVQAAGLDEHALIAEVGSPPAYLPHIPEGDPRHLLDGLRPQVLSAQTSQIDRSGRLRLPPRLNPHPALGHDPVAVLDVVNPRLLANLAEHRPPSEAWTYLRLMSRSAFADHAARAMAGIAEGSPTRRIIARTLDANSHQVVVDATGHLSVPQRLLGTATLGRDIVILEFAEHIELWPAERGWRSCYDAPVGGRDDAA